MSLFELLRLLIVPVILVALMLAAELNLRRVRRTLAAVVVGEPTFREALAGGYRYDHPILWVVMFRNCLHLSVTQDHLRVSPWRPFAWVGAPVGMELAIPLAAVTGTVRHHQLGVALLLIQWTDGSGKRNCIAIRSHHEAELLRALGQSLTVRASKDA